MERQIKNNLGSWEEDRLENFKKTIESRENRFFPDGDASYHQNSDTLVLHHIPKEILDRVSKSEKATRNLNPLLNFLFSETVSEEDLKDVLAHEGTHSWLAKNSNKGEVRSTEEIKGAEESLCYFAGWTQSGIYLEESHLLESKTPKKKQVAWCTQLLIEKSLIDEKSIDWARDNARKIYNLEEIRDNPFRFIFEISLTEEEKRLIKRYQDTVENSLAPLFEQFSNVIEEIEEESLKSGEKLSYRRAKQIESQVDWQEPKKARKNFKLSVYRECREKKVNHANIKHVIAEKAEKEAVRLEKYENMIKNLEHHLKSEELTEEAEKVRKGISSAYRNILVSD